MNDDYWEIINENLKGMLAEERKAILDEIRRMGAKAQTVQSVKPFPNGLPKDFTVNPLISPNQVATRTFLFPMSEYYFTPDSTNTVDLNFNFTMGKIVKVHWTDSGKWTVHDFTIGQRSQFGNVGTMTAKAFLETEREYDMVRQGNRVSFHVTNRALKTRRAWIALEIAVGT